MLSGGISGLLAGAVALGVAELIAGLTGPAITKRVDGAIVGLRRPDQASLITAAASLTLSDEEISEIAG